MEEILQILLLLAYLAIALMSITVPTYAISVSYLARETLKTLEDMRKRRRDLSEKLNELRKKLEEEEPGVEGIKEEIERFEKEEAELQDRLECLSVKGAVGYPLVGFVLGLICAAYGIYIFEEAENASFFILASIIAIFYGLYRLAKSLYAVEQAALRPEEKLLPRFRFAFESGATIERYKGGEQKDVMFYVHNYGEEIAEDVDVMVFFPPDFELLKKRGYGIAKQRPGTRYSNYTAAEFDFKLIHMGFEMPLTVSVKMPQKPNTYKIPVAIRARKMGISDHQLAIEVV